MIDEKNLAWFLTAVDELQDDGVPEQNLKAAVRRRRERYLISELKVRGPIADRMAREDTDQAFALVRWQRVFADQDCAFYLGSSQSICGCNQRSMFVDEASPSGETCDECLAILCEELSRDGFCALPAQVLSLPAVRPGTLESLGIQSIKDLLDKAPLGILTRDVLAQLSGYGLTPKKDWSGKKLLVFRSSLGLGLIQKITALGCVTWLDVAAHSEDFFLNRPGIGPAAIVKLRRELENRGLQFSAERPTSLAHPSPKSPSPAGKSNVGRKTGSLKNALALVGAKSLNDLSKMTEAKVREAAGIGSTKIGRLKAELAKHGLSFRAQEAIEEKENRAIKLPPQRFANPMLGLLCGWLQEAGRPAPPDPYGEEAQNLIRRTEAVLDPLSLEVFKLRFISKWGYRMLTIKFQATESHIAEVARIAHEKVRAAIGLPAKAPLPQIPEGVQLETLGLSTRSYNALRAVGIDSVKRLIALTPAEVAEIKHVGCKSLREIQRRLGGKQLFLRGDQQEGFGKSHTQLNPVLKRLHFQVLMAEDRPDLESPSRLRDAQRAFLEAAVDAGMSLTDCAGTISLPMKEAEALLNEVVEPKASATGGR